MKPKNATPPASVPRHKTRTAGLPATVEHRTPIRANVKTDDSANQRDPRPALPANLVHGDTQQLRRLKTFKHSRPAYQEAEQYARPLTTYADMDAIKDWSPSGQTEDP